MCPYKYILIVFPDQDIHSMLLKILPHLYSYAIIGGETYEDVQLYIQQARLVIAPDMNGDNPHEGLGLDAWIPVLTLMRVEEAAYPTDRIPDLIIDFAPVFPWKMAFLPFDIKDLISDLTDLLIRTKASYPEHFADCKDARA